MRFSGIPLFLHASRAVSSSGTHVNKHLAFELVSWYSSSPALYAALAGLCTPPKRCVAHANGSVSSVLTLKTPITLSHSEPVFGANPSSFARPRAR